MVTLSKPVGMTAKAVNLNPDVVKVQKLLNGIPSNLGGPQVKLIVNGIADAKTKSAIQAFQKFWFSDPTLANGLIEPNSATLQMLNDNSAENVAVHWVKAAGATHVSSIGNKKVLHFVTPRTGTKNVTLTATITPDHALAQAAISWEGAKAASAGRLEATVPAFPERKQVVRIKKADGTVLQEIRVWVVWCSINGKPDNPTKPVKETQTDGGRELTLTAPWTFIHWIRPAEIIMDPDRPALNGGNSTPVPQTHTSLHGDSLDGGAKSIWDASRQVKAKMIDPKKLMPHLRDAPDYPHHDAEGNDDVHVNDEDNNPYDNPRGRRKENGKWVVYDLRDQLMSKDPPRLTARHALGANGDTIERRLHFREFTRIELGGAWRRISDFFEWRFHIRFRRVGGKWENDNSDTESDNDGFDSIG